MVIGAGLTPCWMELCLAVKLARQGIETPQSMTSGCHSSVTVATRSLLYLP